MPRSRQPRRIALGTTASSSSEITPLIASICASGRPRLSIDIAQRVTARTPARSDQTSTSRTRRAPAA